MFEAPGSQAIFVLYIEKEVCHKVRKHRCPRVNRGPWRRRRPPASAGVDCGGRNGQSCRSSFLKSGMGIPVYRMFLSFLSTEMAHLPHPVTGIQISAGMQLPQCPLHSPVRRKHLRLPGGAAGAMDQPVSFRKAPLPALSHDAGGKVQRSQFTCVGAVPIGGRPHCRVG